MEEDNFSFLNRAPKKFNSLGYEISDDDSETEPYFYIPKIKPLPRPIFIQSVIDNFPIPKIKPLPRPISTPVPAADWRTIMLMNLNTELLHTVRSNPLLTNPEIFHTIGGPSDSSSSSRSAPKKSINHSRQNSPRRSERRLPEKSSFVVNFELSEDPRLCETILGHFQTNEMAVCSINRIYTLSESKEEKPEHLVYRGRSFVLEPSETWRRIEDGFLEKNKENVADFQKESLDSISSKYDSLRDRALALRSSLESFSVERFISDYLLPTFNNMREKNNSIKIPEFAIFDRGEESELNLNGKRTVMEQLLIHLEKEKNRKIGGLVIFCGGAYTFAPQGYFERALTIDFSELSYLCPVQDLNRKYKRCFSDKIKELTKQSFSRQISSLGDLQEKISSTREPNSPIVRKVGNFSFEKEDASNYTVYLNVPRFVMKIHDKYYPFPATRVHTNISFCNGRISFAIPAEVEDCSYSHPFVFSRGGICYGALSDIQHVLNIRNTSYRARELDKKEFARGVFETLKLAENSLKYGFKKPTNPVNKLSSFSTVPYSQAVGKGEICDNDKRTI